MKGIWYDDVAFGIRDADGEYLTHRQIWQHCEALKIALADSIRCPMGVIPSTAEGLLSQDEIIAAENRRIEGKHPAWSRRMT